MSKYRIVENITHNINGDKSNFQIQKKNLFGNWKVIDVKVLQTDSQYNPKTVFEYDRDVFPTKKVCEDIIYNLNNSFETFYRHHSIKRGILIDAFYSQNYHAPVFYSNYQISLVTMPTETFMSRQRTFLYSESIDVLKHLIDEYFPETTTKVHESLV